MQNVINFSSNTYRFYHFKFGVSPSQTAVTSLPMMNRSPVHLTSIHRIIRFGAMLKTCHKLQLKP